MKHIDQSQLTRELEGTFHYNHNHWIHFRQVGVMEVAGLANIIMKYVYKFIYRCGEGGFSFFLSCARCSKEDIKLYYLLVYQSYVLFQELASLGWVGGDQLLDFRQGHGQLFLLFTRITCSFCTDTTSANKLSPSLFSLCFTEN